MIRVHVTLKGSLTDRLPDGRGEIDVPEPGTVEALQGVLGLPPRVCVVVVNGAAAEPGTPLADGDRVQVFPPMAGGERASREPALTAPLRPRPRPG